MASTTTDKDEKNMATDVVAPTGADQPGDERRQQQQPPNKVPAGGATKPRTGFFTIYKRGQGYWTRMGTAAGAALVGVLTAHFLYQHLPVWLPDEWTTGGGLTRAMKVTYAACAAFLVLYGLFVYWLINRPTNVDFLIATDSEMKKVNWTSRKELIGSTKVVIVFMFLIAAILFVIDLFFGYMFYLFSVLKTKPF